MNWLTKIFLRKAGPEDQVAAKLAAMKLDARIKASLGRSPARPILRQSYQMPPYRPAPSPAPAPAFASDDTWTNALTAASIYGLVGHPTVSESCPAPSPSISSGGGGDFGGGGASSSWDSGSSSSDSSGSSSSDSGSSSSSSD